MTKKDTRNKKNKLNELKIAVRYNSSLSPQNHILLVPTYSWCCLKTKGIVHCTLQHLSFEI